MGEFFWMDGYGPYVWAAYGITFLVVVGLLLQSWWYARKRTAELAALRERTPRRARAGGRPLRPERKAAGESGSTVSATSRNP